MSVLVQRIRTITKCTGVRHSSGGQPIGFIGLGNMGANMAMNLIKKGHPLIIYDIQSAAHGKFEKMGVKIASTPAELAEQTDRIVTMLPASQHVRSVYTSSDGLLKGVQPGTLLIDSSTIDPDTSKEISVHVKARNATYLDAPVSGGVGAASAGTLTFMVGGPKKEYALIEPILMKMGSKVVHCGEVGAGQAAKICNNMLLAISMIGTAETMNLGIRMGLDAKLLASIINSSSGRCWSSEMYNPVPGVHPSCPSSNNFEGGFGTFLMAKDLGLAQNASALTGSPTPLGSLACQLYRMMCSKGLANKDFSAIYLFLQDQDKYGK